MFSKANKKETTFNAADKERDDVRHFLDHSEEFIKIKRLALIEKGISMETNGVSIITKPISEMANQIERALTFAEILAITDRFDFNNTNDPSVQKLGRNGVNALLYVGSFFHDKASCGYYALHLREKALDVMAEKGYKVDGVNTKTLNI